MHWMKRNHALERNQLDATYYQALQPHDIPLLIIWAKLQFTGQAQK